MTTPSVDCTIYDLSTSRHAEVLVRAIEAAGGVVRRHQYFIWLQSQIQPLLPHHLAVCGAYARSAKALAFDVFNTVALPAPMEALLVDEQSHAMAEVAGRWASSRSRCVVIPTQELTSPLKALLQQLEMSSLLVHGVSRPQRPKELESLFVFAAQSQAWEEQHRLFLDLLLPQMHATYLRVQSVERDLGSEKAPAVARRPATVNPVITLRERQILSWVREGMSNHQIGSQLGISALTVKNHVQRILRKLSATNRAHAVALAMGMNLIGSDGAPASTPLSD